MVKRCFDLLDIPCIKNIEIVAGKNGLSNEIFWVHIAEAAINIENLFDWLMPGDFLIIIGNSIKNNQDALYNIMTNAIKAKLSGILMYQTLFMEYPPKYVIDLANNNNIPIFFLKDNSVSAIEITYYMENMLIRETEDSYMDEKMIKDIYYGITDNIEFNVARANFCGYNLDQSHRGIAIKFESKSSEDVDNKIINFIVATIRTELKNYFKMPMSFVNENHFIALLPKNKEGIPIYNIFNKITTNITDNYPNINIYVALGSRVRSINKFRESICEALEIIKVMKLKNIANVIKTPNEMYSYLLVHQMSNMKVAKKHVSNLLDEINKYDSTHGSSLKKILKVYLEENKNITTASNKVYLHRNTFIYQIKKIEELSGKKLTSFKDDFDFMLALLLEELIINENEL